MSIPTKCQICGKPLDGLIINCEKCDTPHHKDCWDYNEGCAVYGCKEHTLPVKYQPKGLIRRIISWMISIVYTSPEERQKAEIRESEEKQKARIREFAEKTLITTKDLLLVQKLLALGVNVNAVRTAPFPNILNKELASTALYHAAIHGDKDKILILLKNRADVSIKSNNGYTALHAAAYNGHKIICEILADHGANLFLENDNGQTPIDCAKNRLKDDNNISTELKKNIEETISYLQEAMLEQALKSQQKGDQP